MPSAGFASLREQLLEGRVLLPGDDGFEDSLKRWSITCIRPAAAVAQPKTAEEVSAVVKFASANNIAFNVKGGGHSTAPVSSAPSPEGMVLDLSLMRQVSVDAAEKTVTYGGGCRWKEVDEALWPHGLATPGGTVSHTGVGGLVIHGGFGLLSGRYGLTVDVLESCQVVLADGRIVTASKTENEDLFWAMRGAGSSFGVVTKFTSKVFPQGTGWLGLMIFPMDSLPKLVDFINKWDETNDGSQPCAIILGHAPPAPDSPPGAPRPPVAIFQAAHVGPDAETLGPEFFKPVLEMEALFKEVGPVPYPKLNQVADETVARAGRRYLFGGANFTTPLKLSTAEAIRDKLLDLSKQYPNAGTEESVVFFEAIPHKKIRSVPLDSMAFSNRGPYYNILLSWCWEDPSIDEDVRRYNRKTQQEVRSLGYDNPTNREGVGKYANYLPGDEIKAESVFGSNAERLRLLKQKYDPTNMFDKLWKLGGKIEEQGTQANKPN